MVPCITPEIISSRPSLSPSGATSHPGPLVRSCLVALGPVLRRDGPALAFAPVSGAFTAAERDCRFCSAALDMCTVNVRFERLGESVSESEAMCSRLLQTLNELEFSLTPSSRAHREILMLLPFSCSVISISRLDARQGIVVELVVEVTCRVKVVVGKLRNGVGFKTLLCSNQHMLNRQETWTHRHLAVDHPLPFHAYSA